MHWDPWIFDDLRRCTLMKALMTHLGSIEKDQFESSSNWPIIFDSQHIIAVVKI